MHLHFTCSLTAHPQISEHYRLGTTQYSILNQDILSKADKVATSLSSTTKILPT